MPSMVKMIRKSASGGEGGEGGEATSAKTPRKRVTTAIYPSFLGINHGGILMRFRCLFFISVLRY